MSTAVDTENSLLSGTDAAEWLGTTGTTALWYKMYDTLNAVAARMNLETGRLLKSRANTEYYDGDGSNRLLLNNWPLSSTTITVTVDDGTRAFTTDMQLTTTDLRCDTDMGEIRVVGDVFDSGYRNVKVVYTAGYSTSDASGAALIAAAKDYAQIMWQRAIRADSIGIRTESFEGGSRTYETDLPWSVKKVLDAYKDRRYA